MTYSRFSRRLMALAVVAFSGHALCPSGAAGQATDATASANQSVRDYLPFADSTDYQNARRGLIATIDAGEIRDDDGNVVYSMKQFDFIEGDAPASVNPSLWRQSELNSINGLFKVRDDIYQIRGFDLANMTLIKGESGWIIVDPLLSPPTSRAAMRLVDEQLGQLPIKAVIFTHSHIDHFGGIRGIVDEADVRAGKIRVYAPLHFFESAISENVMAGNAMGRRASYMYGNLLPKSATGTTGTGLGQTTSTGLAGIFEPTHIISDLDGETHRIDGLEVEFIYAPESEAPAEMMFYFPALKAAHQAEDISHVLHNLYTLRGAKVRNGQKWSQYIDKMIQKYGDEVEYSVGSHHWPTWGNENIVEYWEKQRDMYRFIHDQTLRLANNGYTPIEIAEMLTLPETLDREFYSRGYYGTVSHNVRAQYELYFGWFDGNPSNLHRLPPAEGGQKYVEFMGGAENLLAQARASYDKGEYRWVAEVVKHLVFADPENGAAKALLADAYEQLGFMAESGPWRNFYLSGAQELREGVRVLPSPNTAGPDMVRGMSTELFFDFLAMRFKGTEANDMTANFNVVLPDVNQVVGLIVGNGVVNPRIGSRLEGDVTARVTINRSDLDRISLGETTFDDLVAKGLVSVEGDAEALNAFLSQLDEFDFWFNIVTP